MKPHMLYGVVPPYMLHHIISYGSEDQRHCAQQTLMHVQSLMVEAHHPRMIHTAYSPGQVQRNIYDAGHQQQLPGVLVRTEQQKSNGDPSVDEAYQHLGVTYDFFWKLFKRNSLDNQGLSLKGTVHYGKDYQNAFWNGQQMVFGDGDGVIFNRFTAAIDIVAHELTHGIIESESNLLYFRQTGALNESIADVFGSLVKQYYHSQTAAQADWLIGEGLLGKGIHGHGLRSLSHPGSAYNDPLLGQDPQPGHMHHYVNTREDNGGVHLNSGIPNRAFYLVATMLGGYAWEQAGQIWYDTVCDANLPQNADFDVFARTTVQHAAERFDKSVAEVVALCWHRVGVEMQVGL